LSNIPIENRDVVTFLNSGNISSFTFTVIASENLIAGNFINIWNDSGILKARKANASNYETKADGFVLLNVANGGTATVHLSDLNDKLSGLTEGAEYYLSDVNAGDVSLNPPTINITDKIVQILGKAISTTKMIIEIQYPITLK
jgi:hypothetical protein